MFDDSRDSWDSETPETPKTMRLYGISGNGNSRSPLSQTMNCNFAQNLLTGWHWLQFSSCVTSNKFFCCKSEIKENWKVIWQKPRESRSLGSLGVLGVSGVSESQTTNCTFARSTSCHANQTPCWGQTLKCPVDLSYIISWSKHVTTDALAYHCLRHDSSIFLQREGKSNVSNALPFIKTRCVAWTRFCPCIFSQAGL